MCLPDLTVWLPGNYELYEQPGFHHDRSVNVGAGLYGRVQVPPEEQFDCDSLPNENRRLLLTVPSSLEGINILGSPGCQMWEGMSHASCPISNLEFRIVPLMDLPNGPICRSARWTIGRIRIRGTIRNSRFEIGHQHLTAEVVASLL